MVSEVGKVTTTEPHLIGLNPCCSGIWFLSIVPQLLEKNMKSLNPCCSGIWFLRQLEFAEVSKDGQS